LKLKSFVPILAVLIVVGFVSVSAFDYYDEPQTIKVQDAIGINDEITYKVIPNTTYENQLGFQGNFYIQLIDKDGNVKETRHSPNLVVDDGFAVFSDLLHGTALSGGTDNIFDFLEIGTGAAAPTLGDSDIQTPIGGCARIQDPTVVGQLLSGGYNATIEVTFSGASCAATVTEAAVFNHLTAGNMSARSTFGGIVVGAGDSLIIEYNMTGT